MARLSKKIPSDLSNLPTGWQSREELIAVLQNDTFSQICVNHVALPSSHTELSTTDGLLNFVFKTNTWQLTFWGNAVLRQIYKSWLIKHDNNAILTGRTLVHLGRIIQGPWFIKGHTIIVWDEYIHFELAMFDGDLARFVDFRCPK